MDRITYRTNRQMLEQIEEIIRQLRIDVNNLTKRIDKLEEKMNNEQNIAHRDEHKTERTAKKISEGVSSTS
jgi:uncharacterized protein YlxW (UPF0749 family)